MDFVKIELEIMEYWDKINLLQTCLDARKNAKEFIFLEGPPTANGLPGAHHVLARAIKDVFCRYQNLLGYKVPRKAGWDCHGLPVELEVEKELGIKTKSEIIKYGVKEFNDLCKKDVFKYLVDWNKLTKRMAFLLDLDDPYITLKNEYIESVWWSLSEIWKKGLLFNDYAILPFCPRCETSLSSHEVALGYKKIEEESIYVKFKSTDFEDVYYLVWTTTPWTLTSNIALAVSPNIDYVVVEYKGEKLLLAEKRLDIFGDETNYKIIQKIEGSNLEGKTYEPLLNYFKDKKGFFIVSGSFVSTEEGTGIVHIAPAFGEDDFNICKEYNLPIIEPIQENGHFDNSIPELKGVWFKDSDKLIMEKLRAENKLFKLEMYAHDYPFCWRCHKPLMYYAKKSWFINMVKIKDKLVELNQKINWVPKFLKDGRFGNFLDNIRNWALSRERFWGTPLPIWKCNSCGYEDCIGSLEELKNRSKEEITDIDLHKPMIDEVKLICPKCKSEMTRVPEVIDCWYDSGAAFLAQWHYPFENEEKFRNSFPVDFISEAIDQTRGWFYTLHAISTLLFEEISYKNVICLGLVVDENGEKMSKTKGNVINPWQIFDKYGADTFRWVYYSMGRYHQNKRLSFKTVEDTMNRFLVPYWNSFLYLQRNAEIKGYKYADPEPLKNRPALDQWIISRLYSTCKNVKNTMDKYDVFRSTQQLELFIEDLSNWYLRISKKRYGDKSPKIYNLAFDTLFEAIQNITILLAPFIPFLTEKIYLSLKKLSDKLNLPTVHVAIFPEIDDTNINKPLEDQFEIVKIIIQNARALRSEKNIGTRQPLSELLVAGTAETEKAIQSFNEIIKSELNIKEIHFYGTEELINNFLTLKMEPNYSTLGKKFKRDLKKNIDYLLSLNSMEIKNALDQEKEYNFTVANKDWTITPEDLSFEYSSQEDFCLKKTDTLILLLNLKLDQTLTEEGLYRQILRRIQSMRKDLGLTPKIDKILVNYEAPQPLIDVLLKFEKSLKSEATIFSLKKGIQNKGLIKDWEISGIKLKLEVIRQ